MAYIVEMGSIDRFGNLVPDYSAMDVYNDEDDAWDAYDKLTENYVHDFLDKDLGFDPEDIGFYKKLTNGKRHLKDECRWNLEEDEGESNEASGDN